LIVKKALLFMAAAGAFIAAGGAVVVAIAFALYALAEPWVGPAGAAASVAGAAAIMLLLTGFAAAGVFRIKREPTLVERLVEMITDQPISTLAAAIAAGFFAVRNPQVLADIIKAFASVTKKR
jgi:hypothetical protein